MDPILIYGFPAGSSMGLVAALEWLGRPYRLCRVDMLGEMRKPPYLRLNPRVETPAFVDRDGRVVTETMAIAAWFEARDDGRRISFDPLSPQADRMHRLMAFINTGFTAAFAPLWQELEMAGDPAPETRAALKALGREWVTKRQDQLEAMIGDTTFLAGDRPTLADGLLVGVARWLDVHRVADRNRWPKLSALRARIEAEPAVIFATAIEAGEAAPDSGSGAFRGHLALAEVIDRFGAAPAA